MKRNLTVYWLVILVIFSAPGILDAQTGSEAPKQDWKDIEYATVDGHRLGLDLYLPETSNNSPSLVVWVHGGAWRSGSKSSMPIGFLVTAGYAVASVDYRLSSTARFPAQVHDIKAAIRFLRARATHYGYSTERIAIAGASAGGHLAALVGVSNGHEELEGSVGAHQEQSSSVHAIIDYFGASNLETILKQSTPHGLGVRIPALQLLLGGQPEDKSDLAKLASPVRHVDHHDPPLLLLHGDQDPQMPINQAHELHGAYLENQLPVSFEVIHGASHGGKAFYDTRRNRIVRNFLNKSMR